MNRLINILMSLIFLIILFPIIIIVSFLIKIDSKGPIFFVSNRVGQYNKIFKMIKFRTMHTNTRIVETSKLKNANSKITKLGKILRKYSIDETPQFISVILGDMNIVGPRPALPSQIKLINSRKKFGIDKIKPGLTGYAQVNGRDLITDKKKINLEIQYLKKKNFLLDLVIIVKTIKVVLNKIGVSH